MGVQVRLVLYAPDSARAQAAAAAAFARLAALDDVMSDYRPDSELMRLCARAGGPPVRVSEDLFRVLARARELARLSDGAFDVTVGPVVRLWRIARRSGRFPPADSLAAARARVGWRLMHLDPAARTVRLEREGMLLDLGGIAKGFAADEALAVLERHGVLRALIEFGGDIVVSGPPPGRAAWEIAVAHAEPDRDTLHLHHAAVSTSGDTEQFVVIDGRRYSHVVDPRTGLGLTHRLAATVVAPDGLTSDGLATLLTALGPEHGLPLVEKHFPGARAYVRNVERWDVER